MNPYFQEFVGKLKSHKLSVEFYKDYHVLISEEDALAEFANGHPIRCLVFGYYVPDENLIQHEASYIEFFFDKNHRICAQTYYYNERLNKRRIVDKKYCEKAISRMIIKDGLYFMGEVFNNLPESIQEIADFFDEDIIRRDLDTHNCPDLDNLNQILAKHDLAKISELDIISLEDDPDMDPNIWDIFEKDAYDHHKILQYK